MATVRFVGVAEDLEIAGLVWQPEIGDEVTDRKALKSVSILVDPQGMTPTQLRATYLWLPTVEQMLEQFAARQAILYHAGLELSENAMNYKTIIQAPFGPIESHAHTFRVSVGMALRDLLMHENGALH